MTKLFIAAACLLLSCAYAASWLPVVSCKASSTQLPTVVDMSERNSASPYYQLVVRESSLIESFLLQNVIVRSDLNDRNELILSLSYNGNNEYFFDKGNIKFFAWINNDAMYFEVRDPSGARLADWVFHGCELMDRGYKHGECGHARPYPVTMSGRPGPWFYTNESSTTSPGRFYPQFTSDWQVQYNAKNQVIGCYDDGCCQ